MSRKSEPDCSQRVGTLMELLAVARPHDGNQKRLRGGERDELQGRFVIYELQRFMLKYVWSAIGDARSLRWFLEQD